MTDIDRFSRLQRLINLFQRLNQISWSTMQTRKRYPDPEVMTEEEIESLTRVYLALGYDIEDIAKEWKDIYTEYKKNETK